MFALRKMVVRVLGALVIFLMAGMAGADTVHLAVSSNFSEAMKGIAAAYEKESGHKVVLSFGSTGKHYAQIRNGAPFDAFFAADAERPALLEKEKRAVAGSRFTYALGRVASPACDQGAQLRVTLLVLCQQYQP